MQQRVRRRREGTDARSLLASETTVVQAKLTLGAPDDAYEQEADRLADAVMRRLADPASAGAADGTVVTRSVSATVGHTGGVRDAGELTAEEERGISASRRGGAPLDVGVRGRMEHGFGADFSGVRVHTGARADQLNRSLTAEAFTTGTDIFFRAGRYRPGSRTGDSLLAHELAHTIQQGATARRRVRRATVPDVQALFGFGKKKKPAAPSMAPALAATAAPAPGSIDVTKFAASAAVLHDAEQGKATDEELQAELTYLGRRKQNLTAKAGKAAKGADPAKELATIDFLEREIANLLQMRQDVAGTKRQAKDIYVQQGKGGGLKALSPTNQFFKNPKQQPGAGVSKKLDEAEIAALSTYTANDYRYINPAAAFNKGWLKSQTVDSGTGANVPGQMGSERERLEEGGLHTGMMMSAFAKLPVWKGNGYRGERLTPDEFDAQYNVNSTTGDITPKSATTTRGAFWSVSTKKKIGKKFADGLGDAPPPATKTVGVLYIIKVSNARDVAEFSNFPEAEVLCPPASTYTTTGVVKRDDLAGTGSPAATAFYEVTIQQT